MPDQQSPQPEPADNADELLSATAAAAEAELTDDEAADGEVRDTSEGTFVPAETGKAPPADPQTDDQADEPAVVAEADDAAEEAAAADLGDALDDADPTAQAEALLGQLQGEFDDDPSAGASWTVADDAQPPADRREVQRILNIEVPVIVKLADCRMPIGSVMNLSPGAIIEFEKHFEEPLDLMINNCPIGRGVAVKVGEKFGLKISQICSAEDKVKSLGR